MDEIRALQGQLQNLYTSGAATRLSERTCVQIVQKLIDTGLLEVMYTLDGKCYITPKHLRREIADELFLHNGRISIVDLQQLLNIDLMHIEVQITELLRGQSDISSVQGELLNSAYLDGVAEEANEILQEKGQLSVADLCKQFSLPADFVLPHMERRVGTFIHGTLDSTDRSSFYTDAFMARQRAKIQGVFTAITRPTQIGQLVSTYGFHTKGFFGILSELMTSGRLSGSLAGKGEKATFVPDIQQRTQQRWIDAFFRDNRYIEFSSVKKLGLSNPKSYLASRFKDGISLESCHVSTDIVSQTNDAIEDCLQSGAFLDVMPLLPSPFTMNDATVVLNKCKCLRKAPDVKICADTYVFSPQKIAAIKEHFAPLMKAKAKTVSAMPKSSAAPTPDDAGAGEDQSTDKKSRRKAKRKEGKKGKRGGSTSSAGAGGGQDSGELVFMSPDEIAAELRTVLDTREQECDEEVITELSVYLQRSLNAQFQEVVRSTFLKGSDDQRKQRDELQKKFRNVYENARLFEKSVQRLSEGDAAVGQVVGAHLLRTLGLEMAGIILQLLAINNFVNVDVKAELTPELRKEMVKQLKPQGAKSIALLDQRVAAKDCGAFFEALDQTATDAGLYFKAPDKKAERQLAFNHKYALGQALETETEPAVVLHLVTLLLFQQVTGGMLHAPGRSVPALLAFLKDPLDAEVHTLLHDYQEAVMVALSQAAGGAERDLTAEPPEILEDLQPLKALVTKKRPNDPV